MIEVRNLCKTYGQTLAVNNVSFDVAKGEVIGFLGPNGAGKSTTLKMLTCYLPPTSGTARVAGCDIFLQSREVRERIGYLPENVPLYLDMRVEEYLDFRGRLRKMPRALRMQRIDYVIERVWLRNVRRKTIGHLSKGYRQRVGLADALLHDPDVLILDEPTVGLDPTQIRETRKLVTELAGRHTIMLSTHILPEVEAVCTRVIVIAGGRVVATGTPDELRRGGGETATTAPRLLVELRPTTSAQRASEVFARLPGVSAVQRLGEGVQFAITPAGGRDIREAVAAAAVQGDLGLLSMRPDVPSLEEFFVRVTQLQSQATTGEVAA